MIAAIVLAAGQSRRMGRPKMILPWGNTTVIEQIVMTLARSGLDEILVVTGGARDQVESALERLSPITPVRFIYNPDYSDVEMISSLRVGLSALTDACDAALITLGDQPQIQVEVVRQILAIYRAKPMPIIVPSYQMRRGHPWLVARPVWERLLDLNLPLTLRDFLNSHADLIEYVNVETPSILQDLDTPADYQRFQPAPKK